MLVRGLQADRVAPGYYEINRAGGTHVIRRDPEARPAERWLHTPGGEHAPSGGFRTLSDAVRYVHDHFPAPGADTVRVRIGFEATTLAAARGRAVSERKAWRAAADARQAAEVLRYGPRDAAATTGPLAVVAERVPTPHGGRNGTPWGTAYRLSVNTRPGTWETVNAWSAGITGLSIVDTDSGWAVVQTHTGLVLGFTVTWESAWRAASRYGFAVADNGLYWDGASATVIGLNPACRAACDAIAREHRNL